jgi:hypothetical protein
MQDNLKTGTPQVDPAAPSHVDGVKEGNAKGNYEKQVGHTPDGRSSAARSTGINADARDAINPTMPKLSPP